MITKLEHNKERAKQRLYKKIAHALKNHRCLFITMSFDDDTLKRTSEATRERYIKQYLKDNTALYIANKDYGKRKGREHYHAFAVISTIKNCDLPNKKLIDYKNRIDLSAYKYGNINTRFIATKYSHYGERNYEITALKIAEHFYKDTAKNSRIIVSREIPSAKDQIKRIIRLYNKEIKRIEEAQTRPMTDKEILSDALADLTAFQIKQKKADQERELILKIFDKNYH